MVLRNEWLKSLEVDNLRANQVICDEHFPIDQIQRKKDVVNALENIVYSVSWI